MSSNKQKEPINLDGEGFKTPFQLNQFNWTAMFVVVSVLLVGMSNYSLRFARILCGQVLSGGNRSNSLPPDALQRLIAVILTSSFIGQLFWNHPAQAQTTAYCQLSAAAKEEKETLRRSALKGDKEAENLYKEVLNQHSQQVQQCRRRTWPQTQSIWLRLYPCDVRPGALDDIMDRVVNRGYNEVYLEVFYDGQVLLPAGSNPTVWPAIIRSPGSENVDLLAQAIQKGHERGLKVYAWMFTMNFGYSYALRPDRQSVIARNGKGETSLYVVDNASQVFVDPYNLQAKRDYYQLVLEVIRRRPDGVLFDYVRYPRSLGNGSIAHKLQDLWIYGDAAQQALYGRALNKKGLELIKRFFSKGSINDTDVAAVDKLYPDEREPLWQGRTPPPAPPPKKPAPSAAQRRPLLQFELWQLSVAHAMQGIVDFLTMASWPVQRQGIPAGAVFFPDANQMIGKGYDSRLQPWDRFPATLELHSMSYANCGNVSCITDQIQRVITQAPAGAQIRPAIAGLWGQPISNRPSLEAQMQAIQQVAPQIQGVSHFAFSWQEPQFERERQSCRAPI